MGVQKKGTGGGVGWGGQWRISDKTVQQADVKSTLGPGKPDPTEQLKVVHHRARCDIQNLVFLLLHTNGY